MNTGINKIILIGTVGKDPEIHEHKNKLALTILATTEAFKTKDGENKKETEWHNLVFWSGLAIIVEKYVRKGMLLYIEGKQTTSKYKDKDGNEKIKSQVVVREMKMLSRADTERRPEPKDNEKSVDDMPPENDLPFD